MLEAAKLRAITATCETRAVSRVRFEGGNDPSVTLGEVLVVECLMAFGCVSRKHLCAGFCAEELPWLCEMPVSAFLPAHMLSRLIVRVVGGLLLASTAQSFTLFLCWGTLVLLDLLAVLSTYSLSFEN